MFGLLAAQSEAVQLANNTRERKIRFMIYNLFEMLRSTIETLVLITKGSRRNDTAAGRRPGKSFRAPNSLQCKNLEPARTVRSRAGGTRVLRCEAIRSPTRCQRWHCNQPTRATPRDGDRVRFRFPALATVPEPKRCPWSLRDAVEIIPRPFFQRAHNTQNGPTTIGARWPRQLVHLSTAPKLKIARD